MNKKLEEYKKRANKIVKTIKLIGISIFLLGVLISIVQYTMNKAKSEQENQNASTGNEKYTIDLANDTVIYQNILQLNLGINEFEENSDYKLEISINNEKLIEQNILERENSINIQLEEEGKKDVDIVLYKNNEIDFDKTLAVYYIEPYQEQFLDELSNVGVCVQLDGIEPNKFQPIFLALGAQYMRSDIKISSILENNQYDFSTYDASLQELLDNNIRVLAIVGSPVDNYGSDKLVSDETELRRYERYVNAVAEHYPEILDYEIWNEPNGKYVTEEQIQWYATMVNSASKILKEKNEKINVISGVVGYWATDGTVYPTDFIKKITDYAAYQASNSYSCHIYDSTITGTVNKIFLNRSEQIKEIVNEVGGFIKKTMSEFGGYTGNVGISEYDQGIKIIQQNVLNQSNDMDLSIVYSLLDAGNDLNNIQHNFGLVKYDSYTPKVSYYMLKNYYQNTNGAEYIGPLNIQSGLEAHIYNKDGKPLMIAWSSNADKTYNFTLNAMTAKDLYGKDLTPDQNGQIQITTSPVYLYNADDNYFYQAISNTATQKYDEFTEQFADQISNVQGLASSIETLKQKMQDIASNSTLNEVTAIELMEQHYNLGSTLMQAYQSGILQIEYVTLSSMLDVLDSIGGAFEDLVTVSATTRNANLSHTLNAITNAENLINDEEIEMIYPSKILEFSQDFYDTADYINSVEEENDIKTGLIVSKNLHSQLLANWALEFANLYISEYILNNPVEIAYSTTAITNQPVTATLQTNASITVTNNSNSKTYTFNQNDSFTFEYTIKGQAFTKTATVTNIDKTAPTITGVENNKVYKNNVTPQVQDANLQEVKLYKDSNLVANYQAGSSIAEDGHYRLVAIDKATNQTEIEFYIARNPASITYSTTALTNQNVTATIKSNFDVKVTNNSNSLTHTFTQNGTFTFQFEITETTYELTATVNNIDKTKPVITGVEQDKQYIEKVTPYVTDTNLKSIELYYNLEKVQGYTSGQEITGEGFYKLVATDQAGNQTTVEFIIIENTSEEYKLQNNYILNIEPYTEKSAFDSKLNLSTQYEITRNGKVLSEEDTLATGDKLRTAAGEEYTIIVKGDINKDGEVNVQDIVKLRVYILTKSNLDEISKLAADCNVDGKDITVKDLVRLRIMILTKT